MIISVLFDDDNDADYITAVYQVGSQLVQIKQKPHEGHEKKKDSSEERWPNVGLIIWQSAFVLGAYLLAHPPLGKWKDVRVLELGSGTGILGIALAKAGAAVTLSDLPHITPLTRMNVTANFPDENERVAPIPQVVDYVWGETPVPIDQPPDIVIGSDVVYEPEHYDALLSALHAVCGASTLCFFAYRRRGSYREDEFEAKATQQGFLIEEIQRSCIPLEYPEEEYRAIKLTKQ